ncbi:MAG TPA: NADH-quinone oxidoreductase subunit H [Thermoanaerobaculia bacterium]|nr:NADH-quinone oxidoreductase subunit H [Thermoanaerobaculia bacterium]
MVSTILQIVLVLLASPLLPGVIARTNARVAGRNGPPILQLYFDIGKLLRKGTTLSSTTTWLFLAGPAIAVVVPLLASLLLPLAGARAPIAFAGDLIVFVYLFAMARFFTTSAALDTGSAFEGMGAARELTFASLAEPALFFGLLALARISRTLSLSALLTVDGAEWHRAGSALVLIIASWFIVLLAENSRVPFDDPNTHLELTMIHEVMVLDHSGPPLGLILYGSAMKLFVFSALIVDMMLPRTGMPLADATATLAAVLGVGIVIGLVESVMARLRLVRVPQLLITASLVAGFAVVLVLR